jgi:hypothetical protein
MPDGKTIGRSAEKDEVARVCYFASSYSIQQTGITGNNYFLFVVIISMPKLKALKGTNIAGSNVQIRTTNRTRAVSFYSNAAPSFIFVIGQL